MSTNRNCFQVQINTTHYVGNGRYRLLLPSTTDFTKNHAKVSVFQYSIYNSTYNITQSLQNNYFDIVWIDGTTKRFYIPDGYYDFDSLNDILRYFMVQQKWYLQNTTNSSQVLYFISFVANAIKYAGQIDILYVPTSLSGYSLPSSVNWSMPISPKYPQIILCDGLRKLFGFKSQTTFPLSQTPNPLQNLSFLSDTYPVLSPIFCYVLTCNLLNNSINHVPSILCQIPLTESFGKLIHNTNPSSIMLNICPGRYNFIEIQIFDQNLNPLTTLIDPELTLSLNIEIDE